MGSWMRDLNPLSWGEYRKGVKISERRRLLIRFGAEGWRHPGFFKRHRTSRGRLWA